MYVGIGVSPGIGPPRHYRGSPLLLRRGVTGEKLVHSGLGFWDLLSIRCHPTTGDTLTRERSERQAGTQRQWQQHQSMSEQKKHQRVIDLDFRGGAVCSSLRESLSDELEFITVFLYH